MYRHIHNKNKYYKYTLSNIKWNWKYNKDKSNKKKINNKK